jgi:hypothetical protein
LANNSINSFLLSGFSHKHINAFDGTFANWNRSLHHSPKAVKSWMVVSKSAVQFLWMVVSKSAVQFLPLVSLRYGRDSLIKSFVNAHMGKLLLALPWASQQHEQSQWLILLLRSVFPL